MKNRINNLIKESMKKQDNFKRNVYVFLKATYQKIAKDKNIEITDNLIYDAIYMNIATVEEEGKYNQDALKQKEILLELLPTQLSEEEIIEVIKSIISTNDWHEKKYIKNIASSVLEEYAGRVNPKKINKCIIDCLRAKGE